MAQSQAVLSTPTEEKAGNYFVSYATTGKRSRHSFLIISKRIKYHEKKDENFVEKNFIIASFGLYGARGNQYKWAVASCGATMFSENGYLQSEYRWIIKSESYFKKRPVAVKTYPITAEQANAILKKVRADAEINKLEEDSQEHCCDVLQDNIAACLTEDEQDHYNYFGFEIHNTRGGPQFNGGGFNCHQYAVYILKTLAGVDDPILEKHSLPCKTNCDSLNVAKFDLNDGVFWDSEKPFVVTVKKKSIVHYPDSYYQLFYHAENSVAGALAVLEDYSENSVFNLLFHYKRHHKNTVRDAVKYIKRNPKEFSTIDEIVGYVASEVDHRNVVGSIHKRLDFLRAQAKLTQSQRAELFRNFNNDAYDANQRAIFRAF